MVFKIQLSSRSTLLLLLLFYCWQWKLVHAYIFNFFIGPTFPFFLYLLFLSPTISPFLWYLPTKLSPLLLVFNKCWISHSSRNLILLNKIFFIFSHPTPPSFPYVRTFRTIVTLTYVSFPKKIQNIFLKILFSSPHTHDSILSLEMTALSHSQTILIPSPPP